MAVELVIGIALLSLVVGVGVGYLLVGRSRAKQAAQVAELETALASSQSELADYKGEVFGQFAATAEKFRALDKSYNDLHRQLAESSVALCGDQATPLLESSSAPALPGEDEQIVVADVGEISAEAETADAETAEAQADAETVSETVAGSPDVEAAEAADTTGGQETRVKAELDAEVDAEAELSDVGVESVSLAADETAEAAAQVGESEVPILTEVDAETTSTRRESA